MKKLYFNQPLNNYFNGENYNNELVYNEGQYYIKSILPKTGIALSLTNFSDLVSIYNFYNEGYKAFSQLNEFEFRFITLRGYKNVLGFYYDESIKRVCVEFTLIINIDLNDCFKYEKDIINGLMKKFNQKEIYSFDLKKCLKEVI